MVAVHHSPLYLGAPFFDLSGIWGTLYARSRTLIGAILSHFVIGNVVIMIGFWDQIA